jgi:glycosyltransferase involved in cell wall biosynthesis
MRIAQVAPLAEAVPPELYGGTERVVSYLTEELVALDHQVTLFASGDSKTAAELVPIVPRALRLEGKVGDAIAPLVVMLEEVARRANEFDVIHVHIDHLHLPLFSYRDLPFLTTLHGRLDLPMLVPLLKSFPHAQFVSISQAQREPVLPFVNWLGTVHHGLPEQLLSLNLHPGAYLAFLGRISPEKGPNAAIRIAERAGLPLKIAAKVDEADRMYFEQVVEPMLRDGARVEFIGEISEHVKQEFLGHAAALLFPVNWPEPFGLVTIEAMACGTPVIAFDRGSVREIIEHGTTGFIVSDECEAVEAVEKLPTINRAEVRAAFEQRFTARRMAENYLDIYNRLVFARAKPQLGVVA